MKQRVIPPEVPPFAISVHEFRTRFYPMSRTSATELVKSGELPTFMDRGRRMILFEAARQYVERKAAAGGAIPPEVSEQKSAAGKKGRAMQLEAAA